MVAGYVGQTAQKTQDVFDRARGGVLFIDEACSLSQGAGLSQDFGQEAIDTLVKLMEDFRDEVVVIAAGLHGSDEPVPRFQPRPGGAGASHFECPPSTEGAVRDYFAQLPQGTNFGNGREARRLFEAATVCQARRLHESGRPPTREDLTTLLPEDIIAAWPR